MKAAQYEVTTLDNGVIVASVEMPHMESVCLGLWASVGSRHEPPRLNGISHFVEHLLFKGTPTRNGQTLSREVEGIGASIEAFTTQDHTCYYTHGPLEVLDKMSEVLLDMFCNPTFDPTEIEREREVILEEIAMYRDTPSQHVEDLLSAAAWPDHALGRPITGTENTIAGIRRGDLFSFHQTRYTGHNVVVTAAGNVKHADLLEKVQGPLGALPAGEKVTFHRVPKFMGESGPRRCEECREVEQSHLCIGFHACGRNDTERFALRVLNVLLGGNMSSRLFQVLREENGLCYNVSSDFEAYDETGLISIYAGMDMTSVPQALEILETTLRSFSQELVSQVEIDQAVTYLVGQSRVSLESTREQMFWCGESLLAHGRVVPPMEAFERLRKVDSASIRRAAERVFSPGRTAIAYIGSETPELAFDAFLADA